MSLNQPATGQDKCPLPLSEPRARRIGANRVRWILDAPLTEELRRTLFELSAQATRNRAHYFDAQASGVIERIGLSRLEILNCLGYLHDVCLVTLDGKWDGWVRFGAKATPRVRQRPSGQEWKIARAAVMRRDGRYCRYCWRPCLDIQIDHVFPLSRGGSNDPKNLCVSCPACNASKGAKTWFEWRFPLGGDAA